MAATGPVVLVTGCSEGGIGSHLCIEFQKRGCRVFASARTLTSMQNLAAEDLHMDLVQMDVNDHAAVRATVEHVIAKAGRIDIVVNNAGYGLFGPIVEADMALVRKQFETNVFGALAVCQAVAPHMMRRRSGKIVNVGSISGIGASPFAGAYASTKAALHALSDSMRMELKPFNVEVIVVAPGPLVVGPAAVPARSAIKSEFSVKSQRSVTEEKLANDSFYSAIQTAIADRQGTSQVGATPTDEFARATVAALLRRHSPPYFFYGRHSTLLPFLKGLLPTFIVDWIFMRMYGLLELTAAVRRGAVGKLKST